MRTPHPELTFILLHGLLCDGDTWGHLVGPLSRLGTVQIARLSGMTSIPQTAAEILRGTTGHLLLIGHSMGGRVALEIANQAPQRCTGLVLMNTGCGGLAQGEIERRMQLVDAARAGGIEAIVDPWLAGMITPLTAGDPTLMNALRTMVLRSTIASFTGQIEALIHRPDATEQLGRIACPTLLLSGDQDTWSPLARHRDMAARISNAAVAAIPHAAHMAPFEAPEACNAAILGWLARQGWQAPAPADGAGP